MKKIFFAALLLGCCIMANAQVTFEALTFSPQFPKAGQTVNFKYNKQLGALIDEKKIDITIYLLNNGGYKITEPKIVQTGTSYSGSFTAGDKTSGIIFSFTAGKEKDINNSKGYFIPVYNTTNEPVNDYYTGLYNFQRFYGEEYLGITFNADKALEVFEKAIAKRPELKKDAGFLNTYLYAVKGVKKAAAIPIIQHELEGLESKGQLTETDYNTLIQWYTQDKRKEKADSLTAALKTAFPEGNWKKAEAASKFYQEKDVAKKLALYKELITLYPSNSDNKSVIENFKSQLVNAFAKAKDYKAYSEWNKQLSKAAAASNDNNIAWAMAEANENIELAKQMSLSATSYAKAENLKPSEKQPDYLTAKQWQGQRKNTYGMYADTYAFILYQTGDYKNGLAYAKDAAAASEFKNAEYNERYSQLMEKVLPAAETKKQIEQFVKEGTASSKTKAILKTLYTAENKSETGYQEYLTKLEMAAKIKKKAALAKTQTNTPAPKFSLKDLDGNDVSLEGLKGKVVVVDFWATWCGPCIASMPAMKTVQEQLKSRDDVVFVFVDTWQTETDKKQNAADFLKKNNYPFHVLLDNEDKVVADFKVRGIPTKFIIDKTGNIRFTSIGFGGNDDALIDEVSSMVELAAAAFSEKEYVK